MAWKPEKWQKNLLAWGIAALVLLFCFTGSPWEKLLPEDRVLFWSEYLGEDETRFVEVQEQLMKEKGWLPKELSVIHAWLREEEWGGTVQYELSSGTWREVRYICAPEVRGHFRLYCQERDRAPDLFAYQQLL